MSLPANGKYHHWRRAREAQVERDLRFHPLECRALRALIELAKDTKARQIAAEIAAREPTGHCQICGIQINPGAMHCIAHRSIRGITAADRLAAFENG